jgi:MFS family permease
MTTLAHGTVIETDLPNRLDRLPWSRWHWRVVMALGVTWILDGLEVTIVGAVAAVLTKREALDLSESQIGWAASAYLAGAVLGSLLFGRLTDHLGRKRLFMVTLAIYLGATLLTSLSWDFWSFALFRALTGAGIGGEASAMNSAIDELLPAHIRGRADLMINGSYWAGTALGAASSLVLLDPGLIPHAIGWRLCFALGAAMGMGILLIRRDVPESPRWLLLHGHLGQAERIVKSIELTVERETGAPLPPVEGRVELHVKGAATYAEVARVLFKSHRKRSILGLAMMISQAFAYNAIFFTYALVLSRFYDVPAGEIGYYLLPFALGNLLGPFVLGPAFDIVGRRIMISLTYAISGILLAVAGYLFYLGLLTATTQTALWCVVFFFASAAASSAYLTVSELFPVDMRGLAIALFYATGIAVGGVAAPAIFGILIESGSPARVFAGYLLGAFLMVGAAVVSAVLGVASERKSLEAIARLKDVLTERSA